MDSEVYRMSHVLRGSLQGALLNLQALAVTLDTDTAAEETIGVVREELLRGSRMLLAAFEIMSLELGPVTRINLEALVRRALDEHGVDRVVVVPGAWPEVTGDARLLALAVAHLARNAREATLPRKRAPEIRGDERDGSVEVTIRDWGRGFGAEKPPGRAFGSSRADHAATGLLTAERIARLHGGRLSFESLSRGTEVRLSLPAKS